MLGTILQVANGGSIWLLMVDAEGKIVDQPVEPRFLADILQGEGLGSPYELEGRPIELADDGLTIELP